MFTQATTNIATATPHSPNIYILINDIWLAINDKKLPEKHFLG